MLGPTSPKSRSWQGHASSVDSTGGCFPPLPASVGAALHGPPWLVDTALQSLPRGHTASLCVLCVFMSLSLRSQSLDRDQLIHNDHILTWWHLQRPCFQRRSQSRILGSQLPITLILDFSISFGGARFTPPHCLLCKRVKMVGTLFSLQTLEIADF